MDLVPFFDVTVLHCLVLLQLMPLKYQSLLVWWDSNSVLHMDLYHQIHHGVVALYARKHHRPPNPGLHRDSHVFVGIIGCYADEGMKA